MRHVLLMSVLVLALHNVISKYQTLCDFSSKDKLRGFIVDRINIARKEISGLRTYQKPRVSVVNSFFKKFYYRSYGMYIWNLTNTTVQYHRIFKCGSKAVIQNFNAFCHTKGPDKIMRSRETLMNKTVNGTRTSFTYVRDPMSRFEAGMAESANLKFQHPKSKNTTTELFQFNSTDMIEKYIQNITNFRFPDLAVISHIAAISGSFFRFDVDIICTLENFTTCWENEIVPTYNLQKMKFNLKKGQHLTSIHHPHGTFHYDKFW